MRFFSVIFVASLPGCAAFANPRLVTSRSHFEPALASVKTDDDTETKENVDAEGLPFWWEAVWELDIMKTGEPGSEIVFGDSARVFK